MQKVNDKSIKEAISNDESCQGINNDETWV
jgi:hypothetical protein